MIEIITIICGLFVGIVIWLLIQENIKDAKEIKRLNPDFGKKSKSILPKPSKPGKL